MIKALQWDRGQFEITVGKGDQVYRQTVSGWVDQAKLWRIHRMADLYVGTHLTSGKAITRFGGGAGKRATARTLCARSHRWPIGAMPIPRRSAPMSGSPRACTASPRP
jgi:hypothetical protein